MFVFFDALPAKLDRIVDLTVERLKRDFWDQAIPWAE